MELLTRWLLVFLYAGRGRVLCYLHDSLSPLYRSLCHIACVLGRGEGTCAGRPMWQRLPLSPIPCAERHVAVHHHRRPAKRHHSGFVTPKAQKHAPKRRHAPKNGLNSNLQGGGGNRHVRLRERDIIDKTGTQTSARSVRNAYILPRRAGTGSGCARRAASRLSRRLRLARVQPKAPGRAERARAGPPREYSPPYLCDGRWRWRSY